MKGKNATKEAILKALADNPHCKPGLLAANRIVETASGILSANGDREMIVLVDGASDYERWYGHVLKVVTEKKDATPGEAQWVALLVRSGKYIDGPDERTIFRRVAHFFRDEAMYSPVFVQEPEDGFALRNSYEEAARTLVGMILKFRREKRSERAIPPDMLDFRQPKGHLDMRSFGVYGLCCEEEGRGNFYPVPFEEEFED